MSYDLMILGGGPGGYTAAIAAAHEGLKVLLVEKENLGGVCLNKGCIPTKSLLKSAEIYHSSVNCAKFGVNCNNVSYDIDAIFGRKNEVVGRLVEGVKKLVDKAGVEVVYGTARFIDGNSVCVGNSEYRANKILLATGGKVVLPPIKGVEFALSSDDVLAGKVKGEKIVIIGGGVIGVEFATFFKKLGKQVTIIELAERILPSFERDVSVNMNMCLKKFGVEIFVGSTVEEISSTSVKYILRGKECFADFDSLIICTGRKADTAELGLENTKVKFDRFGVYVDEYQRTADESIFAIGDVVAHNIQLAHNASAEAEIAVKNLVGDNLVSKPKFIPACVYTSPEIATAGLNEETAKAEGYDIDVGKFLMGANGKAVLSGEDRGFVKVIFDKKTSKILGVSLLCEHATDIIGAITTLVEIGATRQDILQSVYPHPTICEAFYEAVLDSEGKAIHMIKR